MAGQLIPLPGMEPPPPRGATAERKILLWMGLMDLGEEFPLAGLRREVGPGGDVQAAHREWYREQMEEHDRVMLQMAEEFERRSRPGTVS